MFEREPYEGPDFKVLRQSKYKARKHHNCEGCDKGIHPGETYEQVVFLEDGKFGIIRYHHPACSERYF